MALHELVMRVSPQAPACPFQPCWPHVPAPPLVMLPPARAGRLAPATRLPSWPAGLAGEGALEAGLGSPGLGRGSRDWQVRGARQDLPQQTWCCLCQNATPRSRERVLFTPVPGMGPAHHSHLVGWLKLPNDW